MWVFNDNTEMSFWDFGGKNYCKENCTAKDNRPRNMSGNENCAITYSWPPLEGETVKMWMQGCSTRAHFLCEGPKDTLKYELFGYQNPDQSITQSKADLTLKTFEESKSSCVARGG